MGRLLDWLTGALGKKAAAAQATPATPPRSAPPPAREPAPETHKQVIDRHFAYDGEIGDNYRRRDEAPEFLEKAIAACEQKIAMAEQAAIAFRAVDFEQLPSHHAFKQLAIIREKQKDYPEAIRIAQLAKKQGWAGDWDKRIERCQKKLAKQTRP